MRITKSYFWLKITIISVFLGVIITLAIIQPWRSPFSTAEVLARAGDSQVTVTSYRITDSDQEMNDGTVSVTLSELTFTLPDQYHLSISVGNWVREYINIGEVKYIRETGTPVNMESQAIFLVGSNPIGPGLIGMLKQLEDTKAVSEEAIDGTMCFRLMSRYDDAAFKDMQENLKSDLTEDQYKKVMASMEEDQQTMAIEFWIGKSDYLIRKLVFVTSDRDQKVLRTETLNFMDYNQPITISPPEDASGNLLPGWQIIGAGAH